MGRLLNEALDFSEVFSHIGHETAPKSVSAEKVGSIQFH
jgi:hypothetical protein